VVQIFSRASSPSASSSPSRSSTTRASRALEPDAWTQESLQQRRSFSTDGEKRAPAAVTERGRTRWREAREVAGAKGGRPPAGARRGNSTGARSAGIRRREVAAARMESRWRTSGPHPHLRLIGQINLAGCQINLCHVYSSHIDLSHASGIGPMSGN
jgi:hypothetical protein